MKQLQFFALAAVALTVAFLSTSCPNPIKLFDKVEETVAAARQDTVPPAAPSDLTATAASASQIDLSWKDNSNNEEGFEIQQRLEEGYRHIDTVQADSSAYAHHGLSPETEYTYRIRAVNSVGPSAWAPDCNATTGVPATLVPPTPSGISVNVTGPDSIEVFWIDVTGASSADNEESFIVARRQDDQVAFQTLAELPAGTTHYKDESELRPMRLYHYRLKAINANGDSEWSTEISATTDPIPAPVIVDAEAAHNRLIGLEWQDVEQETWFRIERKDGSSAFQEIAVLPANTTSYVDTSLTPNTQYTYRVTAGDEIHDSGPSTPVTEGTRFFAYLIGDVGLAVIDITTPASPFVVTSVDTPGQARDIAITKTHAFIADGDSGVSAYSIEDPRDPTLVGQVATGDAAHGIVVHGIHAYIADYRSGLRIINIASPSNMYRTDDFDTELARGVAVSGPYAYIANGDYGLTVLSVSNPYGIGMVSAVDTLGYAINVDAENQFAYVANHEAGVALVDVSNPAAPHVVDSLSTPDMVSNVDEHGTIAYVVDRLNGLYVCDVQGSTLGTLGHENTPAAAWGIEVSGDYAYVSDWSGLAIIDITQATAPQLVGYTWNTWFGGYPQVRVDLPE